MVTNWSPGGVSLQRAGDRWFAVSTYWGEALCGSIQGNAGIQATVVWTSRDTVTWDAVPVDGVFGFGNQGCLSSEVRPDTITAVVAADDGFVFLGNGVWVWTPGAAS